MNRCSYGDCCAPGTFELHFGRVLCARHERFFTRAETRWEGGSPLPCEPDAHSWYWAAGDGESWQECEDCGLTRREAAAKQRHDIRQRRLPGLAVG